MRNIGNVDLIPEIALILCAFWINNGREIIIHVRNNVLVLQYEHKRQSST